MLCSSALPNNLSMQMSSLQQQLNLRSAKEHEQQTFGTNRGVHYAKHLETSTAEQKGSSTRCLWKSKYATILQEMPG